MEFVKSLIDILLHLDVHLDLVIRTYGFWTYAILFLLAGVETGAIDAVERAYAAELLGEHKQGTGFGVLSTVNGIGDFTSSVTAGTLWTIASPSASFAYGAILAFAAAIMLMTPKTISQNSH